MTHQSPCSTYEVLVCPRCGATSTDAGRESAGKWWSRAGTCHLGDEGVTPMRYVPETGSAASDEERKP